MIATTSYRLGAEELIELGRARSPEHQARRPFFESRPRMGQAQVADVSGAVGAFISQSLDFSLNTLGEMLSIPVNVLARDADRAFNAVGPLLEKIPVMGKLLVQILLLGGAAIKLGVSVPGLTLQGIGNITAAISKALGAGELHVADARIKIASGAIAGIQGGVLAALDTTLVSGNNLGQAARAAQAGVFGLSGRETAALVGIPLVGIAAALFLT